MAVKNIVKFQCSSCKRINYFLHKSKKMLETKMGLEKYCKFCKKHTAHKENKK